VRGRGARGGFLSRRFLFPLAPLALLLSRCVRHSCLPEMDHDLDTLHGVASAHSDSGYASSASPFPTRPRGGSRRQPPGHREAADAVHLQHSTRHSTQARPTALGTPAPPRSTRASTASPARWARSPTRRTETPARASASRARRSRAPSTARARRRLARAVCAAAGSRSRTTRTRTSSRTLSGGGPSRRALPSGQAVRARERPAATQRAGTRRRSSSTA